MTTTLPVSVVQDTMLPGINLQKKSQPHGSSGRILVGVHAAETAREMALKERSTIGELVARALQCYAEVHHPEWIDGKTRKKNSKNSRRGT